MLKFALLSLVTASLDSFLREVPTELSLVAKETEQPIDEPPKKEASVKEEESDLEPMFTDFWWVCVGVALCKSNIA